MVRYFLRDATLGWTDRILIVTRAKSLWCVNFSLTTNIKREDRKLWSWWRIEAWKAALSKFSFYFCDHKSEIVWSHEWTLTLWLSNSSASVNRNTNFIWLIGGLFRPLLLRINRGRWFLPLKTTVEKAGTGLVIIHRLVEDRRIFGWRQWYFCYFI